MHSNPDIEIKNNTAAARRYQLNGKIARVFKWLFVAGATIPSAFVGITLAIATRSWWDYWRVMAFWELLEEQSPFLYNVLFNYFFIPAIALGVIAVIFALVEKTLKNKAKWHGDLSYHLHRRIITEHNQELDAAINEAIRLRDYKLERHLQKIHDEIKRIVRNAPISKQKNEA